MGYISFQYSNILLFSNNTILRHVHPKAEICMLKLNPRVCSFFSCAEGTECHAFLYSEHLMNNCVVITSVGTQVFVSDDKNLLYKTTSEASNVANRYIISMSM